MGRLRPDFAQPLPAGEQPKSRCGFTLGPRGESFTRCGAITEVESPELLRGGAALAEESDGHPERGSAYRGEHGAAVVQSAEVLRRRRQTPRRTPPPQSGRRPPTAAS